MQSYVSTTNYYDFSEIQRPHYYGSASASTNASLLRNASDKQSDDGIRTPTPYGRTGLSWWSIIWRLASGMIFSAVLLVGLYLYEMKNNLDTWDRRLFNSFTILCSSLVSLSLGSLIGILGAALRWPLLAKNTHSPAEVDLLLNMHNPTGSLRLLVYQLGWRKFSVTTFVVLVYLVFNMACRLGVAAFGLVYNLNENVQIEYPVMVTDFSHEGAEVNTLGWPLQSLRVYDCTTSRCANERARAADFLAGLEAVGRITVPYSFTGLNSSLWNATNLGGFGIDRTVEGNKVTYTYPLHEYVGQNEYPSPDRLMQSTATCIGRYLGEDGIYEGEKRVFERPANDTGWCSNHNVPDYVDFPAALSCPHLIQVGQGFLWAMKKEFFWEQTDTTCVTTHMYTTVVKKDVKFIDGALFECRTCLTHGQKRERGLTDDVITNYPLAAVPNFTYALLTASTQGYKSENSRMANWAMKEYDDKGLFMDWTAADPMTIIPPWLELTAADIAARHPVIALVGAQQTLPRVPRDLGASEHAFIITTLQVKWDRAIGVLSAVLGLQVLVIAAVLFVTRRIPVLDHQSYFAVARLMRTAMNTIETGPIAPQDQLAESIGHVASSIRYGTRQGTGEHADFYQLDLWNDVGSVFPKKAKYV